MNLRIRNQAISFKSLIQSDPYARQRHEEDAILAAQLDGKVIDINPTLVNQNNTGFMCYEPPPKPGRVVNRKPEQVLRKTKEMFQYPAIPPITARRLWPEPTCSGIVPVDATGRLCQMQPSYHFVPATVYKGQTGDSELALTDADSRDWAKDMIANHPSIEVTDELTNWQSYAQSLPRIRDSANAQIKPKYPNSIYHQ